MTDEELKELVAGLSISQQETDRQMRAGREAFDREMRASREAFDQEMRASQEKFDQEMQEMRAGRRASEEKADRQMEKLRAGQERGDRQMQAIRLESRKVDRRFDRLARMAGNLMNNVGDAAEEFFYNGLEDRMELAGVHYDEIDRHIKSHIGPLQGEYDIALYNGGAVGLVEVKHKLHKNDVRKFAEEAIPNFRQLFPTYEDHRIYGGMAGFSVPGEVRELAEGYGLVVLTQSGKEMRQVNSPGFTPRAF